MMQRIILAALVLAAGAALAHDDVKNPAVDKRMHAMKAIGAETKRMGEILKGTMDFDPGMIAEAASTIASEAQGVPALFEAPETDPKSEALPAIWENFADFTAKSEALVSAAQAAEGVDTPEGLAAAMTEIGAACKACHQLYRE